MCAWGGNGRGCGGRAHVCLRPALRADPHACFSSLSRLIPVLERHHLLLVSLLVCNAAAMEAMPIFLAELVPSYIGTSGVRMCTAYVWCDVDVMSHSSPSVHAHS